MMECMFGGGGAMFWGMAAAGILLVAVLLLAVAALAKYVFAGAGQEPSWPIPILEFGRRIAVDLTRPGVVCTYNLNNSVEQSSATTPAGFMACAYVCHAPARSYDGNGVTTAYRGGCQACQNLSRRAIRHEHVYQCCPPPSA